MQQLQSYGCIYAPSMMIVSAVVEHRINAMANIGSPGPEVIKLFSCSTQLSMEFEMLVSIILSRNSAVSRLR